MSTAEVLQTLVARGLSLSVAGGRLRVEPAGLLTESDRSVIRLHRDGLYELISVKRADALRPLVNHTRAPTSPRVSYRRPEEIGFWPIPDRQRWGDLTSQYEAEGLTWQEAERTAYEKVKAERKATGEILLFIHDRPDPYPFPSWEELPDIRNYVPGRAEKALPGGHPRWGLTRACRVVRLDSWTPAQEAKDPIKQVTAEGWDQWYPIEVEGISQDEASAITEESK
jgi:hypothetical protein